MVGTLHDGSALFDGSAQSLRQALRLASLQLFAPADIVARANAAALAGVDADRDDAGLALFAGETSDEAAGDDAPHVLPFPAAATAPAAVTGGRPDPSGPATLPFAAAVLPFAAVAPATVPLFDRAA